MTKEGNFSLIFSDSKTYSKIEVTIISAQILKTMWFFSTRCLFHQLVSVKWYLQMTNQIGKLMFSKAGELGAPVGIMCMKVNNLFDQTWRRHLTLVIRMISRAVLLSFYCLLYYMDESYLITEKKLSGSWSAFIRN